MRRHGGMKPGRIEVLLKNEQIRQRVFRAR
jgi:hypothetical protein